MEKKTAQRRILLSTPAFFFLFVTPLFPHPYQARYAIPTNNDLPRHGSDTYPSLTCRDTPPRCWDMDPPVRDTGGVPLVILVPALWTEYSWDNGGFSEDFGWANNIRAIRWLTCGT
uniref:Uncharacterized protein n=1 Tax=Oryza rufipogon TaxID=4529 RepID=A0A0E0N2U3_ORYRU